MPRPVRVGPRYRQTRPVPRRVVETIEITGLYPLQRIDVFGRPGPSDARPSDELAPMGSGARLTNVAELEAPIPLGLVGDFPGRRIRASVAENPGVLTTVLEGRGR